MRSFSPAQSLPFALSLKGLRNIVVAAMATPLSVWSQGRLDAVYMALLVFETLIFFFNGL